MKYIKGVSNVVADALSRLPMTANQPIEESFLNRRVFQDTVTFPLDLEHIARLQDQEKDLSSNKKLGKSKFNGVTLFTFNSKVFVPRKGRKPMIQWYHESLQHSGAERTSSTMRTHFDWHGAAEEVKNYVKACEKCQKFKITGVKKYRKISLLQDKESLTPFDVVHLDMIGPWSVNFICGDKTLTKEVIKNGNDASLCKRSPINLQWLKLFICLCKILQMILTR